MSKSKKLRRRPCKHCKDLFQPYHELHVTCKKKECKDKQAAITSDPGNRKQYEILPEWQEGCLTCFVCKGYFMPDKNGFPKTCGPKCGAQNKKDRSLAYRQEQTQDKQQSDNVAIVKAVTNLAKKEPEPEIKYQPVVPQATKEELRHEMIAELLRLSRSHFS